MIYCQLKGGFLARNLRSQEKVALILIINNSSKDSSNCLRYSSFRVQSQIALQEAEQTHQPGLPLVVQPDVLSKIRSRKVFLISSRRWMKYW
jgi:hypothetical protein